MGTRRGEEREGKGGLEGIEGGGKGSREWSDCPYTGNLSCDCKRGVDVPCKVTETILDCCVWRFLAREVIQDRQHTQHTDDIILYSLKDGAVYVVPPTLNYPSSSMWSSNLLASTLFVAPQTHPHSYPYVCHIQDSMVDP